MNNIFFTADTHLGHANIIRYCNRPFGHVDEMDTAIVENWNAVVRPGDTVYHVGDFSFGDAGPYLRRLQGQVVLVRGNHDHARWLKFARFKAVHEILRVKGLHLAKLPIVLNHFSMRVWDKSHYGSWMLFGHSHGKLPNFRNSVDVGMDPNGFRPLALEEVAELIARTQDLVNFDEVPAGELEEQGMKP